MSLPVPVAHFLDELRRFDIGAKVDEPSSLGGAWFVDVEDPGVFNIEWSADRQRFSIDGETAEGYYGRTAAEFSTDCPSTAAAYVKVRPLAREFLRLVCPHGIKAICMRSILCLSPRDLVLSLSLKDEVLCFCEWNTDEIFLFPVNAEDGESFTVAAEAERFLLTLCGLR